MRSHAGVERVLLVGFMGAGKSTVGRLLADALGWRFFDIDAVIESEEGRAIGDIFRSDGESRFRETENRIMARMLDERQVVLATGGGWSAVPGRLKQLPGGTVSVWLRVSPEEAVKRCGRQEIERPLLAGDDPMVTVRDLLERRSPLYAESDVEVDTEGRTEEDVSASILALLREKTP